MSDVILFHHAQGLTPGIHAFADQLRSAGHRVVVPDLFDGKTFATVEDGVAHARQIGFETIIARGVAAAEALPPEAAYVGFSMGAMPAQKLAQTRPGARAAILFYACVPMTTFAPAWPTNVAVQIHVQPDDPWLEEDLPGAQELVHTVAAAGGDAELFIYPGNTHLFADSSSDDYDPESAELAMHRTLLLLDRLSRPG